MLSKGGFVLAYMVVVGVGCTLPTAWAEAGKRSPVIIIPGDGGNQLEARLTDKPSVPHWWCSKTSDWFRLWLDPKQLLPLEVDCWADNMRMEFKPSSVAQGESPYVNAPGVETRVIDWGGTASLEYLDPTLEIGDSVMFGRVVDALVGAGGERGVSVRGAPYDFRRIPGDEYMSRMRTLVEDAVAANGGSPATLLTHSMGCLIALRFLRGLSAEWREVHIGHWLAVSAPWGGSEGIIRLFASGNNLGVSAVSPMAIRGEQRTSEANFWLLPSPAVYGEAALGITSARNYTATDYEPFFRDIGYPEGFSQYERARKLYGQDDYSFPGVNTTHCYGLGVDTPSRLTWESNDFDAGPSLVEYSDGDGTVGMQSLQAVEKAWQGTGLFSSRVYPGLSHAGILRDEQFLQDMLGLIGWGQRPRQGSGDARNSGNGLVKFLPGDTAVARELLLPGVESNNTDVASL